MRAAATARPNDRARRTRWRAGYPGVSAAGNRKRTGNASQFRSSAPGNLCRVTPCPLGAGNRTCPRKRESACGGAAAHADEARKSGVEGKSVSVRVDHGCQRINKKKKKQ